MNQRGDNRSRDATVTTATPDFTVVNRSIPSRSCSSPLNAGDQDFQRPATLPPPFFPRLGILHGIINATAVSQSLCKGCSGCRDLSSASAQSPSRSCGRFPTATTAFFGGLRSWAFSSYFEDPNISLTEASSKLTRSREETSCPCRALDSRPQRYKKQLR